MTPPPLCPPPFPLSGSKCFVTTYQSFTTSYVLLQKVLQRYDVPADVPADAAARVRLRVGVFVKKDSDIKTLRSEFVESDSKLKSQINELTIKQSEQALSISKLTADKKKLKSHKQMLKEEVIR